MYINGTLLFDLYYWNKIIIYDISDSLNSIQVGDYATPGNPYGIDIDGKYLYIADEDALVVLSLDLTFGCEIPGDVNNDCEVNVGDAVSMINFVFKSGPAPTCSDCAK